MKSLIKNILVTGSGIALMVGVGSLFFDPNYSDSPVWGSDDDARRSGTDIISPDGVGNALPESDDRWFEEAAHAEGSMVQADAQTPTPQPSLDIAPSPVDGGEGANGDEEFEQLLARQEAYFLQTTGGIVNLPPPSGENVAISSNGEYADQINQDSLLETARKDGTSADLPPADKPIPTDDNALVPPGGDYADQVDPKAILKRAQMEGYDLPEVDPGSHPPVESNATAKALGDYADQIEGN